MSMYNHGLNSYDEISLDDSEDSFHDHIISGCVLSFFKADFICCGVQVEQNTYSSFGILVFSFSKRSTS